MKLSILKKVCVVGAGKWGKNHIKTLDNLKCLGGIVDSNERILETASEKYPYAKFYSNLKESLNEDFDGYVIATPAETHYSIAVELLNFKKHILVEKPIALTVKEAKELKKLAEKNQVNIMVGHVLLFHPAIRKIKEMIQEGKIGKLQYLYSNRLNLGTVRTEENILWSFAPHDISLFQYFIEELPIEVTSKGGIFLQPNIHDTTMTILQYPNNIIGHIFVSWLHPFKEQRLVIIGSKGMISFEDSSLNKEIQFFEKGIDWIKGEPIKRDGPTEVIPYQNRMPLAEELIYFIHHLNGDPIEISNGQNAVDVLEVLEQATDNLLHQKESNREQSKKSIEEKDYFIHPTAVVDDHVKIGKDTKIWHFSHVQSGSEIGKNCSLGQNVNVGNNVRIGNFVKIQNNVSVYEGVELEDYVFCGPSMVFTNIKQPRSEFPQRGSKFYLKTSVKKSASLGANCTIVCGVTIGQYSFIGAGAVVTKDIPDFALVVGNPAKRIGWMCMCGKRLDVNNHDCIQCEKCGRKYKLKNSLLFIKTKVE